jgi:hypothetical protein
VAAPERAEVTIDRKAFVEFAIDAEAYGRALFDALIPPGALRERFLAAIHPAERDGGLRVRLMIDGTAEHLHTLAWERLRAPDGRWLLTDAAFYFSRFLSADGGKPIKPSRMGTLSALVAIASPKDENFPDLPPVDVAGERARATTALKTIPSLVLDGSAPDLRATLDALMTELDRGHDVLYLVCHGALRDYGAQVWLEDANGAAHVVLGAEIADRIRDMRRPPRLVVLASCQSGGEGQPFTTSDHGALAALGPLLAAAGVPAVVAMNGDVAMKTIDRFMPKFFEELLKSKAPDRAAAAARWLVRDAIDAHMPVLFSRLRDGRLWYQPGFAAGGLDSWRDLVNAVLAGDCVPIIGPGLLDPILGDAAEITARWADDVRYPRRGQHRLTDVAQFIASAETTQYLVDLLCRDWSDTALRLGTGIAKEENLARLGLPPEPRTPAFLSSVISTVGAALRGNADEVHRVLAHMKVPLYIATTPDNLMADALVDAKRKPQVEILCWNDREKPWTSRFDTAGYQATVDEPVVYHLFGHFDRPTSLVLTEDDHFDYLMHMGSARLPAAVRSALVSRPLLFLGFGVDDWRFRVLYRSIVTEERLRRPPGLSRRSVAVQLDLDQSVDDPRRFRKILERYFEGARVQTYWGTAQDFASDLAAQLKAKGYAF